jgi:DNA-binding GntR family transcriptional regulator
VAPGNGAHLGEDVTNHAKSGSRITASVIAATLEEDIALGLLASHQRLVEEDLAERFTAKRHMVREALVELDTMGIVVRYPNRGAAVKEYSAAEVEQLYLVRALVESCAAKFIPLPAPAAVIHELIAVNASYGRRSTAATFARCSAKT